MSHNRFRVVSVSGGKDSTCVYLWALEKFGIDGFVPVFADTGNEHPVTVNYVRNLHLMANGPEVHIIQADFKSRLRAKQIDPTGIPFLDLALWKHRFPSTKARFCTQFLKIIPIDCFVAEHSQGRPTTVFTGIRRAESLSRSTAPRRYFDSRSGYLHYRPIVSWSTEMVFDYLRRKGISPNPLYSLGFTRVGCFPCIMASKRELALLPDETWEKLIRWEDILTVASGIATFFPRDKTPGEKLTRAEDAREWSRTSRGGRQFDMFAPQPIFHDIPCPLEWAFCE